MTTKTLFKGFLAAAGVLAAGSALAAGVTNTKHDMGALGKATVSIQRGVCSYCHVPHGAKGSRLWAGTLTTGTYSTPVAQLCASCHQVTTIISTFHESQQMFDATSHGYALDANATNAKLNQGWNVTNSGFPYVDGSGGNNRIDCSSCHNPHTGDRRTFLQADHAGFCQRCHTLRDMNIANALMTNTNGSGNSTHPSGMAQTGLGRTATAPINWMTQYRAPFTSNAAGTNLGTAVLTAAAASTYRNTSWWVLGGHRYDGGSAAAPTALSGGVVCMTCHVVHGTDPNTAVYGATGPVNRLPRGAAVLVNYEVAGPSATSPVDNLCIDCHGLKAGATARLSHPAAGVNATYAGEVSGTALDLLTGGGILVSNGAATAPSESMFFGTGGITCLTCHDVHLGENLTPIFVDSTLTTGVDMAQAICQLCHNYDSVTGSGVIVGGRHHPSTGSTNYDTATYASPRVVTNLTYDSALGCNTCHSAHNTVDQGFGAAYTAQFALRATNWTTQAAGAATTPTSMMCVYCHTNNPSRFRYNVDTGATATTTEYGSHWVSTAGSMSATTSSGLPAGWAIATSSYDVYTNPAIQRNGTSAMNTAPQKITNWSATGAAYTAANAYSKYGNKPFSWATGAGTQGGGTLCESCHSVSVPRFNGTAPNNRSFLLLGQFLNAYTNSPTPAATLDRNASDNTTKYTDQAVTSAQGGDGLCLACHGIPEGTHPTTGSTIGRRGGSVLTTSSVVATYVISSPLGGELFYPNGMQDPGMMTCASCHDVHSGATSGAYYILKNGISTAYKPAGSPGTESLNYGVSGSTAATPTVHYAALDFTDMCAACHGGYK